MEALTLLDIAIRLVAAAVLGGIIGLDRNLHAKSTGIRTHGLVAVGSAFVVVIGASVDGAIDQDSVARIAQGILAGIGFLGAGVIMREEGNVRGLNTAATLWGSAAVGAAAGADLIVEAVLGALFVLAANTLLRPIVNTINRKPLDVESVEVTNTVYVIAERAHQKMVMAQLEEELERSSYPTRDLDIHAFGEEDVEIEATLVATSVDGDDLDALVKRLAALPAVRQAFWSPSTTE